MADLLSTGVSALRAFKRSLDVTSHNVANVNTPGYSRQNAELVVRNPQPIGNGFVGQGVEVSTVRHQYDNFIATQTRTTSTNLQRADVFSTNAERLNNLFADSETGVNAALSRFTNAFQEVANTPSSIPARQVLLSEANSLATRLTDYQGRLNSIEGEVNSRITSEVAEINTLSQGVARLNEQIVTAQGSTGQPPNDLLDQRNLLLDKLAQKVNISTLPQDDGAVNVFLGGGQLLVIGNQPTKLTTTRDSFDPTQVGIGLQSGGSTIDITANVKGGTVGGLLDFRGELLTPAKNTLGRTAVALADVVNEQHHAGIDLTGALGGDFFAVGTPAALPNAANTGTGTLSVTIDDVGALSTDDYTLQRTGSGYTLNRADGSGSVALTGTGTGADPFRADGLSIVVNGTPNTGDRFLVQPTRNAIAGFGVRVTDPARVAAAAPIRTAISSNNTGSAKISAGEVLDSTNPQLRSGVAIQFTSANTYSINGAGSFAYTDGGNIDVNGVRVQITGTPAVGDTFNIANNTNGAGDNRNALALAQTLSRPVLDGGTASLNDALGTFVADVGVTTRQAQLSRDALDFVYKEDLAAQDSVSGVNLDEEAANVLRYQQAYQAAAQIIRVADTVFQTLIGAFRG